MVLLLVLLMTGGALSAQSVTGVLIKGNVYGGGKIGQVSENTSVTINQGITESSVYGGGQGSEDDETAGQVKGNATVTMTDGQVKRSIYGGGQLGSVGTFTGFNTVTYSGTSETVQVPKACQENTGLAKVVVSGGHIGRGTALMPNTTHPMDDDIGWIFCGGRGEMDSITYPKAIALAVVDSTYLEISGNALIDASVYGGCENGLLLGNTYVKIAGGQIGNGYKGTYSAGWDGLYAEAVWNAAINAIRDGSFNDALAAPFHECDSWKYEAPYAPYDINAGTTGYNAQGGSTTASDGHTFFGNVFGGGSGYYPIEALGDLPAGVWRRTAGLVKGNTLVEITGGHILSNVYGGGEITDVNGKSTIKMSGGTVGIPRTEASIEAHPISCHIFGAGKGDTRAMFDNYTYVNEVEVVINGGVLFGSVYGGAEDGHVKQNVTLTVRDSLDGTTPVSSPIIGTWGYSGYDGHVFGAGRGFTGENIKNGIVEGNTIVNVQGGMVLGSVYGGGRLASVNGNANVNVSGGTIGNDLENTDHTKGGNVYGASMGRFTKMDNSHNPNWPSIAFVKGNANVTLSGGIVKNDVYGGSEYGSVRNNATVSMSGGTVNGDLFGGGYGSTDVTPADNDSTAALGTLAVPAMLAGRVQGDATVAITAGTVKKSVYGGGELATIGIVKNNTPAKGLCQVTIGGGYIGEASNYTTTPLTDEILLTGHVFGGGKGMSSDAYKLYCNVNETQVTLEGGTVYGSVFGGGADSHVLGNAAVSITDGTTLGTIGTTSWDGNVFGGGRGSGFNNTTTNEFEVYKTCGRVEGNNTITMESGTLLGSIFGGGRLALSGVDVNGTFPTSNWDPDHHGKVIINISGGTIGTTNAENLLRSDESVGDIFGGGKGDTENYEDIWAGRVTNTQITISGNSTAIKGSVFGGGEMGSIGWWDEENGDNTFFANTGASVITINGGTIGTDYEFTVGENNNPGQWTIYDDDDKLIHTCTGDVFGGSQGDVDIESPHWVSMARSRTSEVTINGGTIKASVYGGSEQGSVAGDTYVTINDGTIGTLIDDGVNDPYYFGEVYGGGYGSDDPDDNVTEYVNSQNNTVQVENDSTLAITNWTAQYIAGRVYGNTYIDLLGGTVHGNVFGGGAFAYLGNDNNASKGNATINVGDATHTGFSLDGGSLYGGNNHDGQVKGNTTVNVKAGNIGVSASNTADIFGGGLGQPTQVLGNVEVNIGLESTTHNTTPNIFGDIYGGSSLGTVNDATASNQTTTVNLMNGIVTGNTYGGGLGQKTGINNATSNILATVNGEVHVNVGGMETNSSTTPPTVTLKGLVDINGSVYGGSNINGSPQKDIYVDVYQTYHTAKDAYDYTQSDAEYAIYQVFGGGNRADYAPDGGVTSSNKKAYVNLHQCENTVQYVYGGGDAAAAVGVETDIEGGRYDYVFGGGNGTQSPANIGAGGVSLAVHGGTINEYFGGSNQQGTIVGGLNVTIDNNGPCGGSTNIDEFFCGGNHADVIGDVITTISCGTGSLTVNNLYGGCNTANVLKRADGTGGNVELTVEGGTYLNIYGGSKGDLASLGTGHTDDPAIIEGHVILNIYGGQIGNETTVGNIYGGGNINCNVYDKITVNIIHQESTDCPLDAQYANVYGSGNLTGYTPTSTNIISGSINSPEVNILNGTVLNVYGGSKGDPANPNLAISKVTSSPKVTIGDKSNASHTANVRSYTFQGTTEAVGGRVYGGGHGALVQGNTTVILDGKANVSDNVYGGGSQANVDGSTQVIIDPND